MYVHRFVEWSSLDENGQIDSDSNWNGRFKMIKTILNRRMNEQNKITSQILRQNNQIMQENKDIRGELKEVKTMLETLTKGKKWLLINELVNS